MAKKKNTPKEQTILSVGKRMFPFGSTGWGWDPWLGLESIRLTMNSLYSTLFYKSLPFLDEDVWEPPLDMYMKGSRLIMEISLPGVEKDSIAIHATGSLVIIGGRSGDRHPAEERAFYLHERQFGRFMRSIPLPVRVIPEGLATELKEGIVYLSFPLQEEESTS